MTSYLATLSNVVPGEALRWVFPVCLLRTNKCMLSA